MIIFIFILKFIYILLHPVPWGNLSSLTWNQTHAPSTGGARVLTTELPKKSLDKGQSLKNSLKRLVCF